MEMNGHKSRVSILTALLCVSGCMVGPDYQKPEVQVPDEWHHAVRDQFKSGEPDLQTWWELFNDPVLNDLIAQAGQGNIDLKIATARIEEARYLRGIAKSGLFPQLDATGTAQIQRFSEETVPVPPGDDRVTGYYSLGLEAAWELDLWGRIRRSVQSGTAAMEASIEDYRDLLVVLYAEVAINYMELRTLQDRIQLAQQNAEIQRRTLQLTKDRKRFGLAPQLDVSQAELNLSRTESTIPTLRSDLAQTVHRLAVLTGQEPGALRELLREAKPIPSPPDQATVGLPADLLRQRPDLRRAERNLAAQTERIGGAKAEFYPTLYLPGTLSLEAFDAGNLNGGSLAYAFGPRVRWTIFSAGRVRNQIKVEEIRTEQALYAYEQTVLLALEEVENAMVALAEEHDRQDSLAKSVRAARQSVELVKDLYLSGLTDFQNVLSMERSLFEEEDQLAISEGLLSGNMVRLYKGLGGGWSLPPEQFSEDSTPDQ
jgi:NodT family efflux transporter outer membrane factor (OMF) lipoprotein